MTECFVGIDVAFAKRKRLPVVICTWEQGRLVPVPLRGLEIAPPRGRGNAAAVRPAEVAAFADKAHDYIVDVCKALRLRAARIAIDAPRSPCSDELPRRRAEIAMDRAGISCFATPGRSQWQRIRTRVEDHLASGRPVSRLPHANQLWVLPGFALFKRLERFAPVLEVFPQAVVRALGAGSIHKSKAEGTDAQLRSVARHAGWPQDETEVRSLREIAWAPRPTALTHTCQRGSRLSTRRTDLRTGRHPMTRSGCRDAYDRRPLNLKRNPATRCPAITPESQTK